MVQRLCKRILQYMSMPSSTAQNRNQITEDQCLLHNMPYFRAAVEYYVLTCMYKDHRVWVTQNCGNGSADGRGSVSEYYWVGSVFVCTRCLYWMMGYSWYTCVQGCAIGVGFTAASHLDLAVSKLEQVMKAEMVRKSKGFFGFSKVQCTQAYSCIL